MQKKKKINMREKGRETNAGIKARCLKSEREESGEMLESVSPKDQL